MKTYTETDFLKQVAEMANLFGWRCAHFRPARTATGWRTPCQFDAKGWPDLVLVKGQKVIFAELKSANGKLSFEQLQWLEALRIAGQDIRVWTPECWPEIERTLKG